MKILKDDLDFLTKLVNEFFEQEDIVYKLNQFSKNKIRGWEVWLQVEFALFLFNHAEVSEIEREKRYELDKRRSKEKDICSIDFMIRQKYKQSSIPLEIKQHENASDCIRYMLKDIEKYEKIKGSSTTTGRSLWCLGLHPTVEEDYLSKLINENKFREIYSELVFSKAIQGTTFSFTLI
ncbi:hypothetical protein [Acinetobacter sp.]|uniref:hypothetical protein n=1 Tax=Acinetobacter sp. TaxID=472 RepID=UPI0028B0EE9E|nr:hypothetical protein [Acinetobacter sp.]